jgi:hypothetical protein
MSDDRVELDERAAAVLSAFQRGAEFTQEILLDKSNDASGRSSSIRAEHDPGFHRPAHGIDRAGGSKLEAELRRGRNPWPTIAS